MKNKKIESILGDESDLICIRCKKERKMIMSAYCPKCKKEIDGKMGISYIKEVKSWKRKF